MGGVLEEAAARLNEVSADEADQYINWFNLCTRDIGISFPNAPFFFSSADRSLSASVRGYQNLPSDFDKMIGITIPTKDVKLKYLPPEEFDIIQPSATETGIPMVYTLRGAAVSTMVEYYPVPNAVMVANYKYRKMDAGTSAQSAAILIPLKYSELYVHFINTKGLRRREDHDQANIIESQYENLKQLMISDFKRMTEEPWRIKSVRELQGSNKTYSNEIVDIFWGQNNN